MDQPALDPDASRYARFWEPVLAAAALRTLDRLGPEPRTLLDLGAGCGLLALAAAQRWPGTRITALDPSSAMLAVARSRVPRLGLDPDRFEWLSADAAHIPRSDASLDAAVSSFAFQLVDDRHAVLTEVRRVLGAGGRLSFVTWLADDLQLPADRLYHEIVGDIDGEDEDEPLGAGDYDSPEQARRELARAGFADIEVASDELRHAWTAESYLAFKVEYDDRERLESLEPAERASLLERLVARLAALPASAFEVRGALVAAWARRP